jgi:hypothetical protein
MSIENSSKSFFIMTQSDNGEISEDTSASQTHHLHRLAAFALTSHSPCSSAAGQSLGHRLKLPRLRVCHLLSHWYLSQMVFMSSEHDGKEAPSSRRSRGDQILYCM